MRRRTSIFSALLLLAASACGGSAATGGDGGNGGGDATSGTATTGSMADTTTGSTMATTSSTGGGGDTVTITMDTFTVAPGAEVYYCQNFANPFGGMDVDVQTFESHMTAGSHHLLLFYKPNAKNGPLQTCSGLEFAATPYGSQQPDDTLAFPPGVAATVPGTNGMRLQAHYLNTTQSPVTAHVEVTFHLAEPGTVQNHAGVLFVVDTDISVPPLSTKTDIADCKLPMDMNVIRAQSHMHKHGTDFVATVAGSTVYQTKQWSDPPAANFDTPMVMKQGDPLHFACTFQNNDPSATLTFGESALTNEMCIFTAVFYPTPPGQATVTATGCMTSQQ